MNLSGHVPVSREVLPGGQGTLCRSSVGRRLRPRHIAAAADSLAQAATHGLRSVFVVRDATPVRVGSPLGSRQDGQEGGLRRMFGVAGVVGVACGLAFALGAGTVAAAPLGSITEYSA